MTLQTTTEIVEKAEELSSHIGNLRLVLADTLADMEDYQKELLTMLKDLQ